MLPAVFRSSLQTEAGSDCLGARYKFSRLTSAIQQFLAPTSSSLERPCYHTLWLPTAMKTLQVLQPSSLIKSAVHQDNQNLCQSDQPSLVNIRAATTQVPSSDNGCAAAVPVSPLSHTCISSSSGHEDQLQHYNHWREVCPGAIQTGACGAVPPVDAGT